MTVRIARRIQCSLASCLALAAAAVPLAAQKQQLLFVENSHSGDVSVINATTLAVVGSIPVGLAPDEIVASPAGDVLYLSRIVRRDDGRPSVVVETGDGAAVRHDRLGTLRGRRGSCQTRRGG